MIAMRIRGRRLGRLIRSLVLVGLGGLWGVPAGAAFLARIETSPAQRVELAGQGLPVYWDLRASLLAPLEERDARALRDRGFRIEVLDAEIFPGDYFLVYQVGPGTGVPPGKALWENARVRLVRLTETEAHAAKARGFEMVRLPPAPHPFRPGEPSAEVLSPAPDTIIQRLVGMVSEANLRQTILDLQNFRTRYSYSPKCDSAAIYLFQHFSALGLDSVGYDNYRYQGYDLKNVDALYRGRVRPESLVLTGGHFDSYSNQAMTLAPGADDDASGVAAALEIARVLRTARFRKTLRYLAFSGEEQWMKGSTHWVDSVAVPRGLRIEGFYNLDMIGYTATDTNLLYVQPNAASLSLAVLAESANAQYGVGLNVSNYLDEDAAGDHTPFWQRGFKAVFVIEDSEWGIWRGSNPHYHTTHDTLGTLRMSLVTRATKLSLACLATLAGPIAGNAVGEKAALAPPLRDRGLSIAPNPMREACAFSAPGVAEDERWSVYDATGRLVRAGTFVRGKAAWDGRDQAGRKVGSGVYFLGTNSRGRAGIAKMVLLR